jgi:hypothetical protein
MEEVLQWAVRLSLGAAIASALVLVAIFVVSQLKSKM